MMRNSLAVAVALLVPALLLAEDKYTIKLKHSAAGDIVARTQQSKKMEDVKVTGADGNVLQEKKQNVEEKYKYTEETVTKEKGKLPTKVQRNYSEATKQADKGDTEKYSFEGKKVMIEMKGDSYHFSVDGTELTGMDAGHLTQTFRSGKASDEDMDKILVPKNAVAVGEEWKIDTKAFTKVLGEDEKVAKSFDLDKSKITGKLVKAYKKDGKQFGVLEYNVELPMSKLEGMFPCKEGSKMEMKIVVDGCIDGTIDADSTVFTTKAAGSADVVQDEKVVATIKFDISGDEKMTSGPVKK